MADVHLEGVGMGEPAPVDGLYPLKGGETILYHAAAGGVGLIACQWAKALGLQLIGNYWQEAGLLQAAHAFQQATDWHTRAPAGF